MIDSDASPAPHDGDGDRGEERRRSELDEDLLRVQQLRRLGSDSPEAVDFMEELLVYGIGTLLNLCFTGAMPGKLQDLISQIQLEAPSRVDGRLARGACSP